MKKMTVSEGIKECLYLSRQTQKALCPIIGLGLASTRNKVYKNIWSCAEFLRIAEEFGAEVQLKTQDGVVHTLRRGEVEK